jgi:hypothetical protein
MGANRRGITTCRVGLAEGVRRPKRARSSKRRKASLRCIPWISRAAWRLAAREQTASPLWMVRLLPPIWTSHCRVGLCLIARWAPDVQCSEERAETLAPARHTWFRSVSGKAASRSGLTSVRQKRPTYRLPQGCAENLAPAPRTCFDTCPRRGATSFNREARPTRSRARSFVGAPGSCSQRALDVGAGEVVADVEQAASMLFCQPHRRSSRRSSARPGSPSSPL